jgi:hypothetical protein
MRYVLILILLCLIGGCKENHTDPIPALGMSITANGEGTDKSPAKISMHVNTPDGQMKMEMKVTDTSFSMTMRGK